jgi:hypothetical protein
MIDSLVYFLQDAEGRVKIGRSRLPMARLGEIVRSNGRAIELIGVIPGGKVLERALHISFAYLRLSPDASLGDGRTEWFILDDALLAYIHANVQSLPDDARQTRQIYKWRWTAPILRDTLPTLQEMADALGFIVTGNNAFTGNPAPADMLDAIAAAYRADPAGTLDVLRTLLVPPAPPDA